MTNPGFIPPDDWDLKSDGEQNSLDLRTYSLQLESEIERLEAWEADAVRQFACHYFVGIEETGSWEEHLLYSQLTLLFNIWIDEFDDLRPFVRKDFAKFIGCTTLPDDVVVLHQSIINACAQEIPSTSNLYREERDEELQLAAARYCADNWQDHRHRSILRCILEPDGFFNAIREGALARTRFWIKRILKGRFAASNREDLAGLIRISKAVLSRVRAAYTWEAPTSFLGADDLEVVQWTYPLVCGIPAECSVSTKQLRKEWKAGKCEFGEIGYAWDLFDDYADARRFLESSKWFCSEYQSRANPTAYDVDGECLQAGLKMIAIALREAERFGLPSIDIPNIQNENESAEFVDKILRLTIAEMPPKGTLQAIKSWKMSVDGAVLRERLPDGRLPGDEENPTQVPTVERTAGGQGDKAGSRAKPLKPRSRKRAPAALLVEQAVRSHHKFDGGSVDTTIPPISGRELAKKSGNAFSASSVDRWFKDRFGSKKAYESACLNDTLGRRLTVKEDDLRRAFGMFDPSETEVSDDHDNDHDD